jgi:hypothetical protein
MTDDEYKPPPKMNRRMRRVLAAIQRKAENRNKTVRPLFVHTEVETNRAAGGMNPLAGLKGHTGS